MNNTTHRSSVEERFSLEDEVVGAIPTGVIKKVKLIYFNKLI